jgi:cell wall-associated NlpC family hydrolase
VSANAAAAVAYAKAQVGKAYCYAGTGPTCFDCSGLTYKAWKAGGLTLPRPSGAQFAAYPKVPLNQLQPGDLLFPADPNQHVGIYIGGGKMVHATKPGSTVKEVLMSTYSVTQAVRPR